MDISFNDLSWYWFKGNEVTGRLLQDVCLFRSCVLFESGFRKNFGSSGKNFGDIQYSDFESYHVIACLGDEILGTVRVTPPGVETVALSVLGLQDYKQLIQQMSTSLDRVIEINRLMIDNRVRKLNLGRTLMYASIGLIENVWKRNDMTVIGSAGNCTKQAQFFLNHTDYEKIPGVSDKFASTFNDDITFLKYRNPPYEKGSDKIDFFKGIFNVQLPFPGTRLKMSYETNPIDLEFSP